MTEILSGKESHLTRKETVWDAEKVITTNFSPYYLPTILASAISSKRKKAFHPKILTSQWMKFGRKKENGFEI